MYCPVCNMRLDADAIFCNNCGAKVESNVTVDNEPNLKSDEPVTDTKAVNKSTYPVRKTLGLILGTLIIVIGVITVFSSGTTIYPTSFGADFYTYTYKGIVAVSEILASIKSTLGWILAAIGVSIDINALK